MYSSNQLFTLFALVAGIGNVIGQGAELHQHKSGLRNILKRQWGTPPGGWENLDVNWDEVDYTGGNGGKKGDEKGDVQAPAVPAPSPTPQPPPQNGNSNSPPLENKKAEKPKESPSSTSSAAPASTPSQSEGGDDKNSEGSDDSSGASCPSGCHMTIAFTDDTLDVPFTAGDGGHPKTGSTKGTCICMNKGSVRVNIGTENKDEHTTLIEGNAQGFSAQSFYDVSYVEGYTYPVVCWSDDEGHTMSGSNIDLYEHGSCEGGSKMGDICLNPGYPKLIADEKANNCWKCSLPSQFFAPVSGAAYVYPYDDAPCASSPQKGGKYGSPMATGGRLTCCVGPQCPKNTFSTGGETNAGTCSRPDCVPCEGGCPVAACGTSSKRDLERVFDGVSARKHKRHGHRHAAFHAAKA
ncbi:MAG: hypothetical protein Q9164_000464 [Protoblastenia rupestris]